MASEKIRNRWGIAAAAVLMQICLGAVYGWSVFKKPIISAEHWSETSVQLTFTLAIFVLGIGTIIGGLWQDKVGPRKVASAAGIIYGLGYIVAGYAAAHHSLRGMYLGYGILGGLGMGMGYITPVATLVKWFPDMRGLMTGVAVCGYGFGALIMSPFAAWEMSRAGIPATFYTLGIVYLIVVFATAQFFANPPEGWRPAGWEPHTAVAREATSYNFTVREALGTWQFYLLFAMLFLNVSAGIMVISQASPMAQEIVGMSALQAAGIVGLISLCNGLGRVFWAWVSDLIGRARVYLLLYLIYAIVFFMLPRIHSVTAFSIAVAVIGLCYGGGFGVMPSFTADFFGPKFMGGIYGIILLAWGLGAIPSPIMIARIHQTQGTYAPAIHAVAILMLFSLALPLMAHPPRRKEAPRVQTRAAA
ncbi:MAG: major facilitator superfamily transporter [Candidatus Acidoferrum typicum]|nr:major facilitator superfamily transporter [Candidatus Acidoferrum typicum]